VRLNCPSCTAVLDLSESLVKKLVRCPKCGQNFVVPAAPAPVTAPKVVKNVASAPDTYEMHTEEAEEPTLPAPQDPNQLKFCPGCGAAWKKGQRECPKCHYVAALGSKLSPKERKKLNLNFDAQKLYLFVGVAGVGYGLYMLISHWNQVKQWINSMWA
jgi:predicted Zn finger-like uncharacterized protein